MPLTRILSTLREFLKDGQKFDEIVVLDNDAFNDQNIK